jgi:hypothetical protein
VATIKNLIQWAEGRDPDEPVVWYLWTKDEIAERFPDGQAITNEEAGRILDDFSFPDYAWEGINENFCEAVDEEFGRYRCQDCGDYDKEAQVIADGTTCRGCGEEKEVV